MNFRPTFVLSGLLLCALSVHSQVSPIKLFALKQEPSSIPADSSGTTGFYSTSFEVNGSFTLVSATFALKSITTDSIINQQSFDLPQADGVYAPGGVPDTLIRDGNTFFILLGNITSTEPLKMVAEFKDANQIMYPGILINQ